ncbi:carbohydrate ABC transporter permease [Capillibacterium thermochitinicola]|nr:carbohydrate ABC transporter permease [Capillibacterium thermochitinicola]
MKLEKGTGLVMAERTVDPKVVRQRINRVLRIVFIAVTIFFILAPIFLLFKISVSAPQDILTQHPPFLIRNFTWNHWKKVLAAGHIWIPLLKSVTVATFVALFGLLIAAPAAYVISRLPRGLKYGILLAIFSTRMFPEVGIALPISVTFIRWGLVDTNLGLVLAHLIKVLPLMTWILTGTFDSIPKDLEQSALVDGCDKVQALIKVVLPLSLAGMAAASILCWLESWNEFTYAVYLCLADATLPIKTYYYVRRGNWFESAAYAVFLTIPVMIFTFALQNYLRSDYLSGALKY